MVWVQGVCFRQSCMRLAAEKEVAGWVRSRPDGASADPTVTGVDP
ncbi:MAG: acylphosphatase, partial [Acidimicrobiales bacterium]